MDNWIDYRFYKPKKKGTYEVQDDSVFDGIGVMEYNTEKGFKIPKTSKLKEVVFWREKPKTIPIDHEIKNKNRYKVDNYRLVQKMLDKKY